MRSYHTASDAAKTLLRTASHRLMIPDPINDSVISSALDRSLDWSLNDAHQDDKLNRPFEPSFAETAARMLAFQVTPTGHGLRPDDQREIATRTMHKLIGEHFGSAPQHWFDNRSESARAKYGSAAGVGARYALGLDRDGLNEVSASYEWGPNVMDALPSTVMALAKIVLTHMPQLRPFATTIRCSRHSGGQQISFEIPVETKLSDFEPLMKTLGMGEQHAGFTTLMAFVLGARFTLPPNVATLTLLNINHGPEMRLDVNIDALPDTPKQLLPLLRLPMTERPQNLAALDSWMTAMTPEGYYGPGSITVLSVRVRPELQARLALYLRPLAMDAELPASPAITAPEQTPVIPQAPGLQNGIAI